MKVLALDFDGVICDSAGEAFVVAVRTFAELFTEWPLGPGAEESAELRARFIEIMPLGNRAEDYAVILAAIARELPMPDQAAYDAFCAGLPKERLRAFHKRFYQVRAAWERADPAGWLARLAPYPGFCEMLRRHAGEVQLAIATAKDRHSVRRILAAHGAADLFPDGFVLDKETGEKKHMHVAALIERARCAPAEVTFVDDKVNHLEDVAPLGGRCVLAAWGYNGLREHALARARGFLVCDRASFEAQVFGSNES